KSISYINTPLYMKLYIKHLKSIGVNIQGTPKYINPKVYFDGSDYSLITLNDNISISRDVMFLTHDYSMNTVYKDLVLSNINELEFAYKKINY
ncbi:MAG: hypothetical protein ACYCWE_19175, partial [Eubacteriales bacterium]